MANWSIIRESFSHIECSECKSVIGIDSNEGFEEWNFCPICGASMTEEAEEPCRFKDTCIGACDWCKSHDYSEACVPMLQKRLKDITQELDSIGKILSVIKEKANGNEENANH